MATLDVTVDGDASGAVAAMAQTSEAMANLATNTSAANLQVAASSAGAGHALAASGEAASLTGRMFEGMHPQIRTTERAMMGLSAALQGGAGDMMGLSGGSGAAMAGLLQVGAAALMGGSGLGAIGVAALAGVTALHLIGGSASAAVAPMTDAQRAAQDMAMVFPNAGQGVGVFRTALDATASSLLTMDNLGADGHAAAQGLAAALLESATASDDAATAHHATGSALQYLEASQQSAMGGLHAMVGGMSEVAALAEHAGQSYADFARTLGTQITVPAPNMPAAPEMRASGGPVTSGHPYIVGEAGPELYIPGASGAILPTGSFEHSGGSAYGGPTITYVYNHNGDSYGNENLRALVMGWMRDASVYASELRGYMGAN